MPKLRKPNSETVSHAPQENEIIPTLRRTAEKLLDQRHEDQKAREKNIEDEKEYARALNSLLAAPNGKLVFKPLLRYMRLHAVPSQNQVTMIEENGMRRLYNVMIRPYLEPQIRMEIET